MKWTRDKLAAIIFCLPWQGHVELPDTDIYWLAQEIAAHINSKKERGRCSQCDMLKPILVPMTVGKICEDCIENIGAIASDMRREIEKGGYSH